MSVKKEASLRAKHKALQAQLAAVSQELTNVKKVNTGEHPSPEQARRIERQSYSYGVTFARSKARRGVLAFTSQRRFSSAKEANQHGKRFTKKHGHAEYSVVLIQKRANAWINWRTGKTNPVL